MIKVPIQLQHVPRQFPPVMPVHRDQKVQFLVPKIIQFVQIVNEVKYRMQVLLLVYLAYKANIKINQAVQLVFLAYPELINQMLDKQNAKNALLDVPPRQVPIKRLNANRVQKVVTN